jgi:hypothetical protein
MPDTDVIFTAFVTETGDKSAQVIEGISCIGDVFGIFVAVIAAFEDAISGTNKRQQDCAKPFVNRVVSYSL